MYQVQLRPTPICTCNFKSQIFSCPEVFLIMSDQNGGDGSVEAPVAMAAASESAASSPPLAKKARLEESGVEEKDFDKETQKALEEIDASQNEIDSLNERKLLSLLQAYFFPLYTLLTIDCIYFQRPAKKS